MPIRSLVTDDGTVLELKDGVVIDDSGRPLRQPQMATKAVRLPWTAVAIGLAGLAILIPILITVGFALAVLFALALGLIVIYRTLGRLLR